MKRHLVLVVAVTIGLIAGGCSGNSSPHSSAVKSGGFLRIGTDVFIDSLNPFVAAETISYQTFEYMYPTLVQYDTRSLTFMPDFASSWKASSDDLTWTFTTRAGATWSDGKPLTAQDAAWTLSTIVKYGNGPTAAYIGYLSGLKSATAQGANTLVLTYTKPVANVLANLTQIPILPEHVWGRLAVGSGAALRTYQNTPTGGAPVVSGGPFMLTQFKPNNIALLMRNPHFYGKKPYIDGYGLQSFTNDDAMVLALKTGQIDAIRRVPPTSVATLRSAGLVVSAVPSTSMRYFIINSNPRKTTDKELQNPLVREAFNDAVDRESIVKTAWLGYAQPGAAVVPPAEGTWSDPSIKAPPFNIAKANQLLNQAGYKLGAGGVRTANGHPMSYEVLFPTDQLGPGSRAFDIIQGDFAKIGVKLSQRVADGTAVFNEMTAPNNQYLTFNLAMWQQINPIDPSYILSVFTCGEYGNLNDNGYCNAHYDHLFNEQAVTPNQQLRQQLVYQMQNVLFQASPYIVYAYDEWINAWSKKWTGFVQSPQGIYNDFSKQSLTSVHLA